MSKASNTIKLIQREIGRKSILKFAKIYFSDYMTSQPSFFHEEICNILINMSEKRQRNLAVAAPRGHAKSTIVSLFYAVWSICYSKENYIVLFSATKNQAVDLMSNIKKALESNEKLMNDFPEVCHIGKDLRKYQWTQQEIETKNGIKIHAIGYKGETRGFRFGQYKPTLIIFDDIDGDKNMYSPSSRSNLLKWFQSTVRYLGSKKTNMVAVGTLLHTESLLSRFINANEFRNWDEKKCYKAIISDAKCENLWSTWLKIVFYAETYKGKIAKYQFDEEKLDSEIILPKLLENNCVDKDYYAIRGINYIDNALMNSLPNFTQEQFKKIESILNYFCQEQGGLKAADSFFNDNKELMLEGSKVLWEQEYDYYSLMKIKKIEGPDEFNREMQNDPKNIEDCYFRPKEFIYWTDKYQTEADFVNDARDQLEYFGACDPSMGKGKGRSSDYSAIIILARHKKENIFYVLRAEIKQQSPEELIQEIVNFHRRYVFSNFVIEANLFQGLFIPAIRTQATQEGIHTAINPIYNMNNKEYRIKQLRNFIKSGWIKFCKNHDRLLEQLFDFPMGAHDDGPDALEMALNCAGNTKPGTKWGSLDKNASSNSSFTDDPNKRDYGDQYNPYSDKKKGQGYDSVDDE